MRVIQNLHDFISNKHTLAGQPEPSTFPAQHAGLEERLKIGAVTGPDVDAVSLCRHGRCPRPQSAEGR